MHTDYRLPPTPLLFIDPKSLGYTIQALPLLDNFIKAATGPIVVETDKRMMDLFTRSYDHPNVTFIERDDDRRIGYQANNRPADEAELEHYLDVNAATLASQLGYDEYDSAFLLRPEVPSPFNIHGVTADLLSDPRPGYLVPNETETSIYTDYLAEDDRTPVLICWNKKASQHGDVAQQNLDAVDINNIIRALNTTRRAKLAFFNAVDGVEFENYVDVNKKLKGSGTILDHITDPIDGGMLDIRNNLDRYAAFMSAAKAKGGVMIGVGNTYQHLWYAVKSADPAAPRTDQVVVLPFQHAAKAPWELQAEQPDSPTRIVSKPASFFESRMLALTGIAAQIRNALKF